MVNYKYRWLAAHLHILDYYNQSFFENLNTSTGLHIKNKNARIHLSSSPYNQPVWAFYFQKCVIIEVSTNDFLIKDFVRH